MTNWYNIPGIEFHFMGPWADFQITYNGVRDSVGVAVEGSFWAEFMEQFEGEGEEFLPHDFFLYSVFEEYTESRGDEVKALIEEFRAASDGAGNGELD